MESMHKIKSTYSEERRYIPHLTCLIIWNIWAIVFENLDRGTDALRRLIRMIKQDNDCVFTTTRCESWIQIGILSNSGENMNSLL